MCQKRYYKWEFSSLVSGIEECAVVLVNEDGIGLRQNFLSFPCNSITHVKVAVSENSVRGAWEPMCIANRLF